MQLKKNPRDPQFSDQQDQFEDDDLDSVEVTPVAREEVVPRQRQRAETAADAPVSRAAARAESLIDEHSTFDGKYETNQDLRIQGTVSGEITCRGTLTIEQGATANARIQTRDALVRGRIDGDITCTGRLVLTATAVVSGTMKAAALVVEEGASITGTVETLTVAAPRVTMPEPVATIEVEEAAPAAAEAPVPVPAPGPSVSSHRGPTWGNERRSNGAAEPAGTRSGGRQAPTFAFVPTSEERAADRN